MRFFHQVIHYRNLRNPVFWVYRMEISFTNLLIYLKMEEEPEAKINILNKNETTGKLKQICYIITLSRSFAFYHLAIINF